jgi:hypothetical protein
MARSPHSSIKLVCALFVITILVRTTSAQNSVASLHSSKTEPAVPVILDTEPPLMPPSPAVIIASFFKSEAQVRQALNQHTFKRDVVLQTLGPDGQVTGEYIRNSQFLFDDKGNRIERVVYHPPSTIREMRITREDIQDLAGAQLLGIDIVESTKYRVSYAGDEIMDGRLVYVLSVDPTTKPNPNRMSERFFSGRVWIDALTFQIAKVKGVVEPHGKQRFPEFETGRAPIAGALYFPTHTEADDVLHFPNRDVHYRISVRYYDYKLFASKLKVIEIEADEEDGK